MKMKLLLLLALLQLQHGFAQRTGEKQMTTPWSKIAGNTIPLNQYPRPQMVRSNWVNLNGLWQYCIQPKQAGMPAKWQGQILVPFPLEAPLSGLQRKIGPDSLLWYKKIISVKEKLAGKKLILHVGAADYESCIYVNGTKVKTHRGGYTAFSADITPYIKNGKAELTISVWDPTDQGEQPRGKQVSQPGGIYYTSVTGIWQTVWYEIVPASYVQEYRVTTDLDRSSLTLHTNIAGALSQDSIIIQIMLDKKQVASAGVRAGEALTTAIPHSQWWSPAHPVLYDCIIALKRNGRTIDKVQGYFGMRKIEIAKDDKGINRIFFNHQPLFQYGPLDQGFWPDGIYTAPTEEALISDVERMKNMGFNMVRKHVKVEPARWYYHCDRLGLIVWQDMPSGYGEIVPVKDHEHSIEGDWLSDHYKDVERSPASENTFREEWNSIVHQLYNHPSIGVWVPFNESWGQFKTNEILQWTKSLDPTRLVDGPSGWIDRGAGDLRDYHLYGDRLNQNFPPEQNRALVIGEFGGLGYLDSLHVYSNKAWSYSGLKSTDALLEAYSKLIDRVAELKEKGFSAAVYTQLTDVETEINGLMTYDRVKQKLIMSRLKQIHAKLYTKPNGTIASQ